MDDFLDGVPHEAVDIIRSQIQNAAHIRTHHKYKPSYTALHILREICKIAHYHEIDFKYRCLQNQQFTALSVNDRIAFSKQHKEFIAEFRQEGWREWKDQSYRDLGIHDIAWNLYPEKGSNIYRDSIENGTLSILADQMIDAPHVYGDILAIAYEYFFTDEKDFIFSDFCDISKIMVLGSHDEETLRKRSLCAWDAIMKLLNKGCDPTVILCWSHYHQEWTKKVADSEARKMRSYIIQFLQQTYARLSSTKNTTWKRMQAFMQYMDSHPNLEEMFYLEENSTDTEKNILEAYNEWHIKSPAEYILVTSNSHIERVHATEMQIFGEKSHAIWCDQVEFHQFLGNKDLILNVLTELVKLVGELRRAENRGYKPSKADEIVWKLSSKDS